MVEDLTLQAGYFTKDIVGLGIRTNPLDVYSCFVEMLINFFNSIHKRYFGLSFNLLCF